VSSKQVTDFVICGQGLLAFDDWPPVAMFPDLDPRTARRLARIACLDKFLAKPTPLQFLYQQRVITSSRLVEELASKFKEV